MILIPWDEALMRTADYSLDSPPAYMCSARSANIGSHDSGDDIMVATREVAGWPAGHVAARYWPPVSRIDGAYGDRNVVCSCPPIEALAEN